VNIPKSYLLQVLQPDGDADTITDAELDTLSSDLRDKIKNQVTGALRIDPQHVKVDWFPDVVALAYGDAAQATVSEDVVTFVRGNWDKAGLVGLAMVSLLMVLMLVRKAGGGPGVPGEDAEALRRKREQEAGVEAMSVFEPTIGEASENEHLLTGREVDDASLRTQQVVEQVSELVQKDPDASAAILKRWIDQGKP
jgi:flagellar biosynthesis/type III secretory pathway M-ring protein FliF/YscJ